MKPVLATLAAVRNRKELTLKCLDSLMSSIDYACISAYHVIVDDNSSDGTPEAIIERFPDVTILYGDGSLYWAGAMRYGFSYIRDRLVFDYLITYNDDCIFNANAIESLIDGFRQRAETEPAIVVGSLISPDNGCITYGGRALRYKGKWAPVSLSLIRPSQREYIVSDSLNMNLCCISKACLDQHGFLDPHYIHSAADYDYGLRLTASGSQVLTCPSIVGTCYRDSSEMPISGNSFDSFFVRAKQAFSVKKYPLGPTIYYFKSHSGYLWPLWIMLFYVTRVVGPSKFLTRSDYLYE